MTTHLDPVHPVREYPLGSGVVAYRTLMGSDPSNYRFSMRRIDNPSLADNVKALARIAGVRPSDIMLPNGRWPHDGTVIVAENIAYEWVPDPEGSGCICPVSYTGEPVRYDGIVTMNGGLVPALQGADCSSILVSSWDGFLRAGGHGGTRPVARGLCRNLVEACARFGYTARELVIVITTGAGDQHYEFGFAEKDLTNFEFGGTEGVFTDPRFRIRMSDEVRADLTRVRGFPPANPDSLAMTAFIVDQLERLGVPMDQITVEGGSSIMEVETEFSYRRRDEDDPMSHGLGMSLICRR